MSHPDPLQAYFEASEAPASDPAFRVSVMADIARERLMRELVKRFAVTVVLTAAIVLFKPVLVILQAAFLDIPVEVYGALALVAVVALAGQYFITHTVRVRMPRLWLS